MEKVARSAFLVVLVAALVTIGSVATAAPVSAPHLTVELVAETTSLRPGRDANVGAHFVLEKGWHVYWRNPGDSGEAPRLEWTLPPGFTATEIEFPAPQLIAVGPLANYGYEGEVLLPVALGVPADAAVASTVDVRARAKWLVCNPDECVPGSANLSLTLPIAARPPQPAVSAALFEETRAHVPMSLPATWQVAAHATRDAVSLDVHAPTVALDPPPAFFPYEREVIEHAAPQRLTRTAEGFALALTPWAEAEAPPAQLAGVLRVGGRAYTIAVPVGSAATGTALQPIVFAFAGGLLLNLMPCVFPVLAFKALALVGLAAEGRRRARMHGLLYLLGVLASFWALAGILLAVRAGGAQLGWGFQLQSPIVVALLACLFFWMALVLLGVSTVGASLMGAGQRLTSGGGLRAAFYTGVLATVVATPCTAPFMGTALGYALVQPAPIALGVFTALAVGLALPYVLLTFVPGLGAWLPRPGRWMETLEQLLAFPLLATVVWLVWVVSLQAGPGAVAVVLGSLVLLALAAWTARRWHATPARLVAAALVVVALALDATLATVDQTSVTTAASPRDGALAWEPYSSARVAELVRAGKPVFIDFTAAWCVTCQVNERLALATPAVVAKMRDLGVIPLRADWTRPDPDITRALQEFGREGVPLYVLYSGKGSDPPRVLPQILTTDIVLDELAELGKRSDT